MSYPGTRCHAENSVSLVINVGEALLFGASGIDHNAIVNKKCFHDGSSALFINCHPKDDKGHVCLGALGYLELFASDTMELSFLNG